MIPRSGWRARARRHHPGRLVRGEVVGLALHWPAMDGRLSRDAIPGALRNWQDYHMDGHGWSDIGYQAAVDQWGRKWTLRGLENRSAANGGIVENGTHGAILLILGPGENPSPAMIQAVREIVSEFRRLFPGADELAGHGDVRLSGPTECPGPAIRKAIKAGTFEPAGSEDEVSWTSERFDVPGRDGAKWTPANFLRMAYMNAKNGRIAANRAMRQANRNADALERLAVELGPDVAGEVAELLGERLELDVTLELELQELEDQEGATS